MPNWLHADAAAIHALRGDRSAALASLERAVQAGWIPGGPETLDDLSDEPAFASLRTERRFVALRARLAAHFAREREGILKEFPA